MTGSAHDDTCARDDRIYRALSLTPLPDCSASASTIRSRNHLCAASRWTRSCQGGIEAARLLEPFAMVWIAHEFKNDVWTFALTPVEAQEKRA